MAEAYCVKDKQKVEVLNPAADHDEERQGGPAGHLSDLRWQGLQDRRLTPSFLTNQRPSPATAGAVPCPGAGRDVGPCRVGGTPLLE